MRNPASGAVLLQGCLPQNKGLFGATRRLDTHAFVYVYSGTGNYRDENGCSRRVVPGTLMLLFPGLGHTYDADTRWAEVFFIFRGPAVDSLEQSGLLDRRNPVMEALPAESWKRRLLDALPLAPPQSESGVARNLFEVLHLLVAMIDASRSGDKNEGDEKWLHRARRAISKSLEDGTGPLAAGAVLGEASAEAFRKRFTRLQGCSPSQYRFQLQVEQASLLLRSGGMGLKQIASRLGFHDEFHFSKRFKAATGLSPSEFRKL